MDITADIGTCRLNGFLGGLLIVGTATQWIFGGMIQQSKKSIGNEATFFIIMLSCLAITIIGLKLSRSKKNKGDTK